VWRAATLLMFSTLAAAQPAIDFSGVWEMNVTRSTAAAPTTAIWMMVERTPSALNVTMRVFNGDKEEKFLFKYAFGLQESSNDLHGAHMASHLVWEGRTLLIASLAMYGSQPLHMEDRWTLDGTTLTIKVMTQFDRGPARNSVRIMERRAPSQWPPENTKAAEEVYKNIQSFKGLPASRIPDTMTQFTRDLGVTCAFCHTGPEMASDDKPTKSTARWMIDMTNRINSHEFDGEILVTCVTCHRGSAKP
jgi:Photosynthetic reaction centre cytochrome C subunit